MRARNGFRSSGVAVAVGVTAVLLALAALLLAPGVAATPSPAPDVEIVGAGTLDWKRVVVRATPSPTAGRVAVLTQFRKDFRPQYVLAVEERRNRADVPTWYRILVPGRPNGRSGWVRAASVDLRVVAKRLVIYRDQRRFEFWHGDRLLRRGKIAVGARGAETPLGLFYVTDKFNPRIDPDWAILGAFAFETSAYSKLTDWPGGGIVGVHGTPWPWLLGKAVSHGCVRLHNRDVLFLRHRVPVGTPVLIVR